MPLFSPNKDFKVRGVILKLLNANCPGLVPEFQDARSDKRVNLAVVVALIPLAEGKTQGDEAFTAVTKDFSSSGVSVVSERPFPFEQAILGFRIEGQFVFVLAEARHVAPMGGGLFQVGFQLIEVVAVGDYPGLESVNF